ncbi:MAG: DUF928 domain-containing protein [Coleofasciculaceae cyanobacterium]
MTKQQYRLPLALFTVSLFLPIFLLTNQPSQGQESLEVVTQTQSSPIPSKVNVTFKPPGKSKPDYTVGGASRDSGRCPEDVRDFSPTLTGLMPDNQQGLSVAERPTFFVYVPATDAKKAFFSIKDKNEDYYYQTSVSLPSTPGIISFQLPVDAPVLEIGKDYDWSFVMICGQALRPGDPEVRGIVKRIEQTPALKAKRENLSPLEIAATYGNEGVWFDTLATIAQLRRSQPSNQALVSTWEEILKSVGLEEIATEPLL